MAHNFDRLMAALDGVPDTAKSRPVSIRVIAPILGNVETFIVQTFRQKDSGDYVFIEHTSSEGFNRYCVPPEVVRVIMRQRDALETQNRRRAGRAVAAERKAAGLDPAFMRKGRDNG